MHWTVQAGRGPKKTGQVSTLVGRRRRRLRGCHGLCGRGGWGLCRRGWGGVGGFSEGLQLEGGEEAGG